MVFHRYLVDILFSNLLLMEPEFEWILIIYYVKTITNIVKN